MSRRKKQHVEGLKVSTAVPLWFCLIFALIGVGFLAAVYGNGFRPSIQNGELKIFQRPDDIDLWTGCAICVVAFSGAGAAMLAHRSNWTENHRWNASLAATYPEQPWRWRTDWDSRQVIKERVAGRKYYLLWAILCGLAAAPGCERWLSQGGLPDDPVDYTAIGAAAIGALAFLGSFLAVMRSWMAPAATLHLASETGVVGGPLEGAIQYEGNANTEYLVRLVCEKHWISERRNSDGGKTRSHELKSEYDDTYRAFSEGGLIPVRFAIPFNEPETSRDWYSPVYLWFVELENAAGQRQTRFWVPVFKTPESSQSFTLGSAGADRSIAEETPQQTLSRYGITVNESGSKTVIDVPPGRSGGLAWGLTLFGLPFLIVGGFMLPKLWTWKPGFSAVFDIITGLIFGGLFGLIGLLLFCFGLQLLLERRRIEIARDEIRVRRSYFGLGWNSSLRSDEIEKLQTTSAGSSTGQRQTYQNVVAKTTSGGLKRPDGTRRPPTWNVIHSVPDEAAEAAQTLIESIVTS